MNFIPESTAGIVNEILDDIKENIGDHQEINEQMDKLSVHCKNWISSIDFQCLFFS